MATVTIQEAQAKLPDLIHNLSPGDEVLITENNQPVAKLVSEKLPVRQRPGPGLCKGMINIVADDLVEGIPIISNDPRTVGVEGNPLPAVRLEFRRGELGSQVGLRCTCRHFTTPSWKLDRPYAYELRGSASGKFLRSESTGPKATWPRPQIDV